MKRRQWAVMLVALILGPVLVYWQPWHPRLRVIAKGGKCPPDFMLLHGYGSSAEGWLPYAQTISLAHNGRFLLSQTSSQSISSSLSGSEANASLGQ
jgi:hypothetical protein